MVKVVGYGVGYGFGFVVGFALGVVTVYTAAKMVVTSQVQTTKTEPVEVNA